MRNEYLGEIEPLTGGRTAENGQWLIIFRHNNPIDLLGVGRKIRRGWGAPFYGAQVASLITAPQSHEVVITDVLTSDDFVISSMTFDVSIRLTPEKAEGSSELLRLIRDEGRDFGRRLDARVSHAVSSQVRAQFFLHTAEHITYSDPLMVAFPGGRIDLVDDLLEATSVRLTKWSKAQFAEEIMTARQKDKVGEELLNFKDSELTREAALARLKAQHAADAARQDARNNADVERLTEAAKISLIRDKARAYGWDAAAIGLPDAWKQMSDHKQELVLNLFNSPHALARYGSDEAVTKAIISHIMGISPNLSEERLAMLNPEGGPLREQLESVSDAAQSTQGRNSRYPQTGAPGGGLAVSQEVVSVWGDEEDVVGASFAVSGSLAIVLMAAARDLDVANEFEGRFLTQLLQQGLDITKVKVLALQATSIEQAVAAVVATFLAPEQPPITTRTSLRLVAGRKELVVELSGNPTYVRALHKQVSDPRFPLVAALEKLAAEDISVRFARPFAPEEQTRP